jgi:flagellin
MSLIINTNTDALIAQNNLQTTDTAMSSAMQDLSSGLRINSAADDAAGYAITEDLTGQVNGLNQATSNAQDGVSLVQTAQGTLNDVEQMLQRIRELAVQAANGTNSPADTSAIQSEVNQLSGEITQLGTNSQFNGISLFAAAAPVTFQVGANDADTLVVTTQAMTALVSASITVNSAGALASISGYIDNVSAAAANYGAVQNTLGYAMDNLATYSENLSAAQSNIQDVNMASEETMFSKDQVLEQAGVSMLAQANQDPQMILKLLGQ